jgi:hypothetical protein
VFGDSFLRLCPFRLSADVIEELGMPGRTGEILLDPEDPNRLLQHVARVRRGTAAWRSMWLFAEAMVRDDGTRATPTYHVAQIPYVPGEAWVGGPLGPNGRPSGSRLSLLVCAPGMDLSSLDGDLSGLVIDEWTELVPNQEEQTGVAFHYDDPGAEAAQAILIAVPPEHSATHWSLGHLVAAIQETFELAKLRAVEPVDLGEWGQVLPATYLSTSTRENLADEADDVSTRFDGLLVGEPEVV